MHSKRGTKCTLPYFPSIWQESSRGWVQMNGLKVGYESFEFAYESAEIGYQSSVFEWVRNDVGYESTGCLSGLVWVTSIVTIVCFVEEVWFIESFCYQESQITELSHFLGIFFQSYFRGGLFGAWPCISRPPYPSDCFRVSLCGLG